jgi:polysaccharide pyruvyl transferase WcaK-like protein
MGSIGPTKASLHVGLISPYTGSNLGDQAIHLACIEQLQIRCPDMAFTAICLNPSAVARVHNVSAFSISGLTVPFYTSGHLSDTNQASLIRKAARAIKGRLVTLHKAVRWSMRAWRLIDTLDAVIVAGGGQIDDEWGGPWGHPWSLFSWALLCRMRGKRFLVLSVGFCSVKSALSRGLLHRALRTAAYLSCRDEGSVTETAGLIGQFPLRFVPDLACSLPLLRSYGNLSARASDRGGRGAPLIVVSPIAFGRSGSWPTEADAMYRRYIAELGAFCAALLAGGYRLRVIITSSPDEPAIDELMEAVRAADLSGVAHRYDSVEIFKPGTVTNLCALLLEADCVVISRLHGVMLSQLLLRPVLAISFDRKVNAQMAQARQDSFLTQIQTVTREELNVLFENLLASRDQIRERLRRWSESSDRAVQDQFDTVVRLLSGSNP